MLSIFILLFIILIIHLIKINMINKRKIEKDIIYEEIPNNIIDLQYSKIDLLNKYSNLFFNENIKNYMFRDDDI